MNLIQKLCIRVPQLWYKFKRITRTRKLLLLKKSDKERWSNPNNLLESWDDRNQLLGDLIPKNTTVLEFGAGRLELKKFIDSSCTYIPSDIVPRNEETFVCDLNALPFPKFPKHNVTVFSGVIEYLFHLPELINALASQSEMIVCSYACFTHPSQKKFRLEQGWLNAFTEKEFLSLFEKEGFSLERKAFWKEQTLFLFHKK